MKVRIRREEHIRFHLKLLNGFLSLSDKEISIVESFVKLQQDLSKLVFSEKLLNNQLFSSESRKQVRKECKISSENLFNNYFGNLKKKGVIESTDYGYKISSKVLPETKVSFEIEFID